ncbi:MAG: hypothetical protein IJG52_08880 [Lachnospiraceae bacterium]|nr:hypothetical protein [Lachnospiraceae bacterium]
MKYFTQELWDEEAFQRTAGNKARNDISQILEENGFQGISVAVSPKDRHSQNLLQKAAYHVYLRNKWKESLSVLQAGDTLLIQFPIVQHSVLLESVIAGVRKRGVKIILLIHDLEILRSAMRTDVSRREKIRLRLEEESLLRQSDALIVHNAKMREELAGMGYARGKMAVLGIFDYLIPETEEDRRYAKTSADGPLIVAGVLRRHKAAYAYALPDAPRYNLYGVDYEGEPKENVTYHGSFPADELPGVMEGSFGLVWDGDSVTTCSGTYGAYLRINNPHKVSLYLASGLPVMIWKEAALAEFVKKNGCGIPVGSLEEIPSVMDELSAQEYEALREGACKVARRLRAGRYTMRAVNKALERIGN